MVQKLLAIEGINPEPWTAAQVGIVGKHAQAFPNEKLVAYQNAIAEEVEQRMEAWSMEPMLVEVTLGFTFWRSTTGGQPADATNLQKGTEDALQGYLFPNDSQVKSVTSTIANQGPDVEPLILIQAIDGFSAIIDSDEKDYRDLAKSQSVEGPKLQDNIVHKDEGDLI